MNTSYNCCSDCKYFRTFLQNEVDVLTLQFDRKCAMHWNSILHNRKVWATRFLKAEQLVVSKEQLCFGHTCVYQQDGQVLEEAVVKMEEDFTCPIYLERGNKMIKFLKEAIEKKEEDLKCPICLETAKPPIFMCPASHIICSACGPKVQKCPECREELPTPLWR